MHCRAALDKLLDLASQPRRHKLAFRKHEQLVAHAAGEHQPAVADGQPQYRVCVAKIVVVAGWTEAAVGGVYVLAHGVLAYKVQGVGHKPATLEQVLASG